MNLTKYFNISRFRLFMKVELCKSRKGIIMTFVVTFGLLFFISFLLNSIVDQTVVVYDHNANFAFAFLVGGFILSSLAYHDLRNSHTRSFYLTLPVSAFEKFLCMWLLTTVGWIVIFTLIYTIYTLIVNVIGENIFTNMTFPDFNPLGIFAIRVMKYYFVLQGVFLVGAIFFKGNVLLKTLFALVIAFIGCGFISYLFIADMFPFMEEWTPASNPLKGMPIENIWHIMKWIFWWLLAPLCWVITYFGLKEKEV